jgi:hypothetical protein
MRICAEQRLAALEEVHRRCEAGARVWLVGTRPDDGSRGGNVDLFVEAESGGGTGAALREVEAGLALEDIFDGGRVDLLVRYPGEAEGPIFDIARQSGVLL